MVPKKIDLDESHPLQDRRDQPSTSRQVHVGCPNCHRKDIRIPAEYINRRVQCKYCEHIFRARLPDDFLESVPARENDEARQLVAGLEDEVETLRGELARRTAEHVAAAGQVQDVTGRLETLAKRVRELEEERAAARQKAQDLETLRRTADRARDAQVRSLENAARAADEQVAKVEAERQAERDRATASAQALQVAEQDLRERVAAERDRLREELTAARTEHALHAADAVRAQSHLAGERDRFREELLSARSEVEARSAANGPLARLQAELAEARASLEAERDRLHSAVEAAGQARDAAEGQLAALRAEGEMLRAQTNDDSAAGKAERERLAAELAAARTEHERHAALALSAQAEVAGAIERAQQEAESGVARAAALEEALRTLQSELDCLGQDHAGHTAARDQLQGELAEARTLLASTSRQAEEWATQARDLQAAVDRLRQERAAEARQHAQECEVLRQDRDTERRRSTELQAARAQAEESRKSFRDQIEQLRTELDAARRLAAELRGERDRLLTERAELTAGRPAAEAAARRADELSAQLQVLREENDRLYQDRNAEADQHGQALEALRSELERLRSHRQAEQAKGATGDAARTELQQKLAEALRDRSAAFERAQQLEVEVKALRERPREQHSRWPDSPHEPSPAGAAARSAAATGRGGELAQQVEDLTHQLRTVQEANERLRTFLAVIGTTGGKGAEEGTS
jgi:chromosome segregation protein